MDNILYFPHISIPEATWLTRSILYWDEVASIIPFDLLFAPDGLTHTMRELIETELVRPLSPGNYTYKARNFTQSFLHFVDNDPTMVELQKRITHVYPRRRFDELPFPSVLIHMEKLDEIAFELQHRGLAVRNRNDGFRWGWYKVETMTAYYFMAYLATVIGAVAKYQPTTDKPTYLSLLLGAERSPILTRSNTTTRVGIILFSRG